MVIIPILPHDFIFLFYHFYPFVYPIYLISHVPYCSSYFCLFISWSLSDKTIILKANGMNVLDVDPAFRKDLDEMGRTLRSAWVKKAGSDAQAIFDQYAKITGRDL